MQIMFKITYEGAMAHTGVPCKNVMEFIVNLANYDYRLGVFTSELYPVFNNIIDPRIGITVGQMIINHVNEYKLTSKYKTWYDDFGLKIEAKKIEQQSIFN